MKSTSDAPNHDIAIGDDPGQPRPSLTTGPPMFSYRMISAALVTLSVGRTTNGLGVIRSRAFKGITSLTGTIDLIVARSGAMRGREVIAGLSGNP